ncbi:hypothetical protein [Virgibacillus dakarensis]
MIFKGESTVDESMLTEGSHLVER